MLRRFSIALAVACLVAVGLFASRAHAALTPWEQQVFGQLAPIDKMVERHGLTLRAADDEMVQPNGGFSRAITLNAGTSYVFAIACDRDCGSPTLQIYDQNGGPAGTRNADMTVVAIVPDATGQYRVEGAIQCRNGSCGVGVAMWSD